MNDTFETQAYAQVWTSSLNRYIEDGQPMSDSDVNLYSGGLPDDYSQHYTYIPVGKIKVKIPSQEQPNTPCLLYTSPSPRDGLLSRMPSSA